MDNKQITIFNDQNFHSEIVWDLIFQNWDLFVF